MAREVAEIVEQAQSSLGDRAVLESAERMMDESNEFDDRKVEVFFVGPGKTGTSWIYEFAKRHGFVTTPSLKEPYLLDKPADEAKQLIRTLYPEGPRLADFSNMYSDDVDNPTKVVAHNPHARVIVTTRKPSERIVSHYAFEVRSGAEDVGLSEYMDSGDAIGMVRRSTYRDTISRYLSTLPRDQVLVLPLEQLREEPQVYVDRLTDFLGVERIHLTDEDLVPVRVRSRPRSRALARAASRGSAWLRRRGFARTLGALKNSRVIAKVLYRPREEGIPMEFGTATPRVRELDADYPNLVMQHADFVMPKN